MSAAACRQVFPEAPTLVLYHAECADGFGAAWAIWRRFPEVRFLPVKHGEPHPRIYVESVSSSSISVMRDRSSKDIAKEAQPVFSSWTTTSPPNRRWPIFHSRTLTRTGPEPFSRGNGPTTSRPHGCCNTSRIRTYGIGSCPTAAKSAPPSRPIRSISSYGISFRQHDLEGEGRAILRYENELVTKLCCARDVWCTFEGATVPAVQSPVLTSQIGERLSADHPFCLIWHDRNGRRYYSMRSREDGTDVEPLRLSSEEEDILTQQDFRFLFCRRLAP